MAKSREKALKESYLDKQAKTTLNTFKGIKGLKVKTIYDGLYIRPNCAKGMITPIDDWVGVDEDGNRVMLSEVRSDKIARQPFEHIIKSPEHLMTLYLSFLDYIRDNDYNVYPTKVNFSQYIGINYNTLYNYLRD